MTTIQVGPNRLVTVDEIMTDTCWTRERVAATLPHDPCTVAEILAIESVPPKDRIYQAVRFVGDRVAREFACRVASTALTRTQTTDARPWDTIHTARRYVLGLVTGDELEKAAATAWTAWEAATVWTATAAGRTATRTEAAWAAAAAAKAAAWATQTATQVAALATVSREDSLAILRTMVEQVDRDGTLTVELEQ